MDHCCLTHRTIETSSTLRIDRLISSQSNTHIYNMSFNQQFDQQIYDGIDHIRILNVLQKYVNDVFIWNDEDKIFERLKPNTNSIDKYVNDMGYWEDNYEIMDDDGILSIPDGADKRSCYSAHPLVFEYFGMIKKK